MIIGSTALKYHFPELNRAPKDLDVIVNSEYDKKDIERVHKPIKLEILINPVLIKHYNNNCPQYIGVNELYTLKMSHVIGWELENNSYEKHLWDLTFLKSNGCKLIKPLFYELYNYWNELHGINKRSDLEMSSEDFFNNALKCEYSHDYLHTLINPIPTYTKVLKGEVEVCEKKFNKLIFKEKCDLVREEVYIMSWERQFHKDYRISYGRMLRKFIRNHAPLWEAIWILENFKELYKPEFDYFKLLNQKTKKYGKQNLITNS